YINRVLKTVHEFDHDATLTKNLQSHSARRGGAVSASSNASINLSDLAHRGLWSMDGFATLLEYISPTTASDHNVAKVLGCWSETKQAGHSPSLACFQNEPHQMLTRVSSFAQVFQLLHFSKIFPKAFADCLTGTLLMYYRDTLEVSPQHILHQEMQRVHDMLPPLRQSFDEILEWGSKIRSRFVMDNILSLPTQTIKENTTLDQQAHEFVGIHIFADTLEPLVLGQQQLIAANEDLKRMIHRLIDRFDHQPGWRCAYAQRAARASPSAHQFRPSIGYNL
ncbi:hypothetical protein PHMEG_00023689, partial [Phytophthora megakarya]